MFVLPQGWDPAFQMPMILPPHNGDDGAELPDVMIQALVAASYRPKPMVSF